MFVCVSWVESMRACVYVCVHEGQRTVSGAVYIVFVFETGSLLWFGTCQASGPASPRDPPVSSSLARGLQFLTSTVVNFYLFFCGFWGSNPDPHACTASAPLGHLRGPRIHRVKVNDVMACGALTAAQPLPLFSPRTSSSAQQKL